MEMDMKVTQFLAATAALVTLSAAAFAGDITLNNLRIEDPFARATLPNQPVAGGFMVISNTGLSHTFVQNCAY